MKNILLFLGVLSVLMTSCYKMPAPQPNPNPSHTHVYTYQPTDSTNVDTPKTLVGTTWILYQYLPSNATTPITTSDTLVFVTNTTYTYNGFHSTYSMLPVTGGYSLVLNGTFYGNLSGIIFDSNLTMGQISYSKFSEMVTNQVIYLWMKKK
mgnify:FL=1